MWIALGQMRAERALFAGAISAYQVVAIFGLHFALTLPGKLLHRPTKFLFYLMAQSTRRRRRRKKTKFLKTATLMNNSLADVLSDFGDLRSLFRLNLLIGALHVPAKRRYGMTYMALGLITLTSFVKVSEINFLI